MWMSFCCVSEIQNTYQMTTRNGNNLGFSAVTVPTLDLYMLKSDRSECEILPFPHGYKLTCSPT